MWLIVKTTVLRPRNGRNRYLSYRYLTKLWLPEDNIAGFQQAACPRTHGQHHCPTWYWRLQGLSWYLLQCYLGTYWSIVSHTVLSDTRYRYHTDQLQGLILVTTLQPAYWSITFTDWLQALFWYLQHYWTIVPVLTDFKVRFDTYHTSLQSYLPIGRLWVATVLSDAGTDRLHGLIWYLVTTLAIDRLYSRRIFYVSW